MGDSLLSLKWNILIILYHNCHRCFSNVLTLNIAVAALYRGHCNKVDSLKLLNVYSSISPASKSR